MLAVNPPVAGAPEAISAPSVPGLTARLAADGQSAAYLDAQGRLILTAVARLLGSASAQDKKLGEILQNLYPKDSQYVKTSTYPRFQYNIPGVQAGFYGIDAVLSATQVILLKEALELFTRPVFQPLLPAMFKPEIAFTVIDKIGGIAAGLTFSGTGVVELDRRDLFNNKYFLASVIAHESAHVLQGDFPANAACADILRREVGDQTIPPDFLSWDATKLLAEIPALKIGAYHVSLWTLYKLGLGEIPWIAEAIRTGRVGGESVVDCAQSSPTPTR